MQEPATKPIPPTPEISAPAQARLPAWLPAVLLGLVTLALYWPATHHDFVNYDDNSYVTANLHVQAGLTWDNLKWAFLNPVSANWHPLTVMSHMLDCQLYGLNPWGHHLTSILLHAVNTMLVFVLLRRLTGAMWRSVLVAAMFGWHPLHVESVAWVAERKDVLSTSFGLLALIFYARYAEQLKIQNPKYKTYYWLTLVFFACGLMSKAMLVTWPLVMLLLDYWPLGRWKAGGLWRLVREKLPFLVLAAAASIVTIVVQKHGGAVKTVETLPLGARGGNALVSYCRYLGKLFWPAKLAVLYPHPGHWPLAEVVLAGALLSGPSVLFWWHRRRCPFLLMGWLWFIGTLVPVIGLVQVGNQALADRYTYIPSLGLFILVVWGAYELTQRWRYRVPGMSLAGGAAMVLCLGLTRWQLGYWQDSEALFRHAVAVTKINPIAHDNLGIALGNKGQIAEAISEFQDAIRLKPDYADAHYNLGTALLGNGRIDEAVSQFQEAIRLKPDYADAHNNLGTVLRNQGRIDEAIRQFQEAIRLEPDDAEPHNNYGIALFNKGQTGEAISQLQAAIRLKPDYANAHFNLGNAFLGTGDIDGAISQYQEAIRLNPENPEARKQLARALEIKNAPAGR